MSGPVPTLGYKSKSQAAVALDNIGLSHREIAQRVGVAVPAVGALIHSGKRAKRPLTRGGTLEVRALLDGDTIHTLQQAAEVRHVTIAVLAARLLTLAAQDGLIPGILDDGDQP